MLKTEKELNQHKGHPVSEEGRKSEFNLITSHKEGMNEPQSVHRLENMQPKKSSSARNPPLNDQRARLLQSSSTLRRENTASTETKDETKKRRVIEPVNTFTASLNGVHRNREHLKRNSYKGDSDDAHIDLDELEKLLQEFEKQNGKVH